MTPTQRAKHYWESQRNAEGISLVEFFRRCENDILDEAAGLVSDDLAVMAIQGLKWEVV